MTTTILAKDLTNDVIGKILSGRPGSGSPFSNAYFTAVGYAECSTYIRLFVDCPVGPGGRTWFDLDPDDTITVVGSKVYAIDPNPA